MLAGEPRRLILQLGDFGIWPDRAGQRYLARVSRVLAELDAELWFIDGNHEDFPQLARLARDDRAPDGRVLVRPGLLPSAPRLPLDLARPALAGLRRRGEPGPGGRAPRASTGGRRRRSPTQQEAAVIAGGHADVMVSHDCPAGVAHTFGRPPPGGIQPTWPATTRTGTAAAHRGRRPAVPDHARPPAPGLPAQLRLRLRPGPGYRAGCGRRARNFAVLDVAEMRWELREGWFGRSSRIGRVMQ